MPLPDPIIHAAICEIDRALTSNMRADEALIGAVTPAGIVRARSAMGQHRIELIAIQRRLRELLPAGDPDDRTPVRPPSRDDMRAALAGAQAFPSRPPIPRPRRP